MKKIFIKFVARYLGGSKKEAVKYAIQILISILSAILTALGASAAVIH